MKTILPEGDPTDMINSFNSYTEENMDFKLFTVPVNMQGT